MRFWRLSMLKHDGKAPFTNVKELYETIDAIKQGNSPWQRFTIRYNGPRPANNVPAWMTIEYEVWTRDVHQLALNMLSNPDFAQDFEPAAYRDHEVETGKRRYKNLMSGNWAWRHSVRSGLVPAHDGAN